MEYFQRLLLGIMEININLMDLILVLKELKILYLILDKEN